MNKIIVLFTLVAIVTRAIIVQYPAFNNPEPLWRRILNAGITPNNYL
jgi:hypothetical protein